MIKRLGVLCLLLTFVTVAAIGQTSPLLSTYKKGDFYAYWGWNRSAYTGSDISFQGENYDFTLSGVVANDRQTPFSWNTYFNPGRATIPQYNFRLGYFLNDKYQLSFGSDHMKYVVQQGQSVTINGHISESATDYDGTYDQERITIEDGFLAFEHTDGLNYLNLGLRRNDNLFRFGQFSLNFTGGLEVGMLVPRTNTTLLNNERYDQFHLSGYGLSGIVGLNLTIYQHFFLQTECKAGFINMPDIRTTRSELDRAGQKFYFTQFNWVFGSRFRLWGA